MYIFVIFIKIKIISQENVKIISGEIFFSIFTNFPVSSKKPQKIIRNTFGNVTERRRTPENFKGEPYDFLRLV
jgi:hypothetical protein